MLLDKMITLVLNLTIYVCLRILLTGLLFSTALYVHGRKNVFLIIAYQAFNKHNIECQPGNSLLLRVTDDK